LPVRVIFQESWCLIRLYAGRFDRLFCGETRCPSRNVNGVIPVNLLKNVLK